MDAIAQDTPEWFTWRNTGVGGSEIAPVATISDHAKDIARIIGVKDIMEISPYSTALEVFNVKTGKSKGFEGNSFTEHGKALEAKARARYEFAAMEDAPPTCATHPKFKCCIVSLDGWRASLNRVVEFKCPKGRAVLDAALAGLVIPYYVPQTQYQIAVTGAEGNDFFVYHDESGLDACVLVRPNLELQGLLVASAVDFWERYVLKGMPPPLTDRDFLDIASDDSLAELCRVLATTKDKTPKKIQDEMKANIIRRAGHPKIVCGRVKISTVMRNGKFSFHKLTVSEDASAS